MKIKVLLFTCAHVSLSRLSRFYSKGNEAKGVYISEYYLGYCLEIMTFRLRLKFPVTLTITSHRRRDFQAL